MAKCPFGDPQFVMSVDEPCPVCGMYGFDWPTVADNCVGDVVDTGDELHQILGEALSAVGSPGERS